MPKIKVVLSKEVIDGQPITFIAPCDCSEATGLKVSYPGGTKEFAFKDSHGNNLTGITELFLKDAYVRVIVDTVNGNAFIQNADTNAYIEDTFLKKAGGTMTGALMLEEQLGLESGGTGAKTPAGARTNLGLDYTVDTSVSGLTLVKSNGIVHAYSHSNYVVPGCTIPVGYRPQKAVYLSGVYVDANSNKYVASIRINATGVIEYNHSSSWQTSGSYIRFQGSWQV